MNEMTINTHDLRTVSFDGELIDQQSVGVRLSDDAEAFLALRLYAVRGGGFVPVVEFTPASATVENIVDAEQVDLVKDVECFFLLFEPAEHVDFGTSAAALTPESTDQQLRRNLMRKYYSLVGSILEALAQYRATNSSCEVIAQQMPNELNRIWNFFGIGRD